jgi:carbamoyltransferase
MNKIYLGISDTHDSGVALISDGKVLFAINEERLTRKKMDCGFPTNSLHLALSYCNINPRDIVGIGVASFVSAVSDDSGPMNNDFSLDSGKVLLSQKIAELIDVLPFGKNLLSSKFSLNSYLKVNKLKAKKRIKNIKTELSRLGIIAPLYVYEHHDCHVATVAFTTETKDALIISNDGFGDGICSKVATLSSNKLNIISVNPFFNSIGIYYNIATLLCGFRKSHHAGKTTGLAAYGNSEITYPIFKNLISWDDNAGIYINYGGIFRNAINSLKSKFVGFSKEDIAAGIQRNLENVLVSMVSFYIKKTKINNILLVGGVHANVKANQAISNLPEVNSLFIFPNMGDGGLALGAAILCARENSDFKTISIKDVYWGPEYTNKEIEDSIKLMCLNFYKPLNISQEIAHLLSNNLIVARFNGRMEYGPRALGNRSILYAASDRTVNSWLNMRLNRTEFMPFAPVIRDIDAAKFFKCFDQKTSRASGFMTLTYDVTELCKIEAPAVVHVDDTARPQVITRAINESYYDILSEYKKLTGLSILVNTSFNMHEEPIVCTPSEAIHAFLNAQLDILAIGPYIVTKSK